MKTIKFTLLVVILSIGFTNISNALVLENLIQTKTLNETLKNKKVCYYIGSFDPLHLGHEDTARLVVEKGFCDYTLVYPAIGSGAPRKHRVATEYRFEMLYQAFKNDPKVITTKFYPKEFQEALTVEDKQDKEKVKPKIQGLKFIGVIGSDNVPLINDKKKTDDKTRNNFMNGVKVKDNNYNGATHALIIPVEAFVIALRNEDNISDLPKLSNRSIIGTVKSEKYPNLSSTLVKKTLREGKSIDEMVNPDVERIIINNELYD